MSNLRGTINIRMDNLQAQMEANKHIAHPAKIGELVQHISRFWNILSEEDRDYLHMAQDAIDEGTDWKV